MRLKRLTNRFLLLPLTPLEKTISSFWLVLQWCKWVVDPPFWLMKNISAWLNCYIFTFINFISAIPYSSLDSIMNGLKHILQLMLKTIWKIAQMNCHKIVAGVSYCVIYSLFAEHLALCYGIDDMQRQISNRIFKNFLKSIDVKIKRGGFATDWRIKEDRLRLLLLERAFFIHFRIGKGIQLWGLGLFMMDGMLMLQLQKHYRVVI